MPLGLTKRDWSGQSLLKTINGKPIATGSQRSVADGALARQQTGRTSEEEFRTSQNWNDISESLLIYEDDDSFINAPPRSCSSDEDEPNSADIKPTIFRSLPRSSPPRATKRDSDGFRPVREAAGPANITRARIESSPPLRRKAKAITSPDPKKLKQGGHTEANSKAVDMFGNIKTSQTGRKTNQNVYGSQAKKRSSKGSTSNSESSPEAMFKTPLQEKETLRNSPERRFKSRPDLALSPKGDRREDENSFKFANTEGLDLSPIKQLKFKATLNLDELLGPEDDGPAFRKPSGAAKDDESPASPEKVLRKISLPFTDDDEKSQTPVFQASRINEVLLAAQTQVCQTSASRSDSFSLNESSLEIHPPSPKPAKSATCPMCGEAVDTDFLKSYNKGKQMNVRLQTKFCSAHKKRTAREEWISRGYPTIDWASLDVRIAKYHSFLMGLVEGASSHSRTLLDENVKAGKNRTLKQAAGDSGASLTPGYYGPRGLRAMSENIMARFSPRLRRVAVTDRLVSARGVIGYVQAVLVPELAVRLIGEDLRLGIEEAREVMGDSAGLGELLNDEVEDVVSWRDGDVFD